MTFPLPFGPGAFIAPPVPSSVDKRNTIIIPDGLLTSVTPAPKGKLSEAEIDAALAKLRSELKPTAPKKKRLPDPDPPGMKYPYVTQFCTNGGHQGQIVLSFRGTLMVSCRGEYSMYPRNVTCTCWCHKKLAIQKAAGAFAPFMPPVDTTKPTAPVTDDPRPAETPTQDIEIGYNPNETPFNRLLKNTALPLGPRVRNLVLKHLGREVTPEMLSETYVTRKRGELDSNVEAICRLWLAKAIPWDMLTTDVVSLLVDVDNPPSPGAVHAVFTRWDEQNFAIIRKGPVRFECFTPTVQEVGIEAARNLAYRRARASERGFKI